MLRGKFIIFNVYTVTLEHGVHTDKNAHITFDFPKT